MRKPVYDIRLYGGQLLDVVRSRIQFVDRDRTVAAGRDLSHFLRTVCVLVDTKLDACQRGAVVADLLDLQSAERGGVHTKARSSNNLSGGSAEEDLL